MIVSTMLQQPFSKRNRYAGPPKEITIREDAPENLRYFILDTAHELGGTPSPMRDLLCHVLHTPPDQSNWSEYPNVDGEVQTLMYGAEWYKVYDFIEYLHSKMVNLDQRKGTTDAQQLSQQLNEFLVEEGIGWQLVNGQVVSRGTEAFEAVVTDAAAKLEVTRRPTAARQLHLALQDLSHRPAPDLHGAIYHAMGCLEAVARDLSGEEKLTLGQTLTRYPQLIPPPLDSALSQVWGYASNEARHVQEGKEPNRRGAELIVGLAASVAGYLTVPTQNFF
jgi:hypothetical protein